MKICLPTENWNDVFGFVPRPQLAELSSQIGDWYFASKAQFYLHECGKITLGKMVINSSGKCPVIRKAWWNQLPLADVPMPENVKNFTEILLSHYDDSVLRFLQEFHRNSLFTNANVTLIQDDSQSPLLAFMANLLPFFTNINSISVEGRDHNFLPLLQNRYPEMAMKMLTSARVLQTDYNAHNGWYCDWLHIPRDDGRPRVLRLFPDGLGHRPIHTFIEHIKKDFLSAKQAVSFLIFLDDFRDWKRVHSVTLENEKTNEKLMVEINRDFGEVSISRYPSEANEEWIEEMAMCEDDTGCGYRYITIDSSYM